MSSPQLPFPPRGENGDSPTTKDVRAEFEALSRQTPRNEDAERRFVEHKIELIRSDPNLGEQQKEDAIALLRRQLGMEN